MHFTFLPLMTMSLGESMAPNLPKRHATCQRAAYILSNNPSGDSILSLAISTADGTVSNAQSHNYW